MIKVNEIGDYIIFNAVENVSALRKYIIFILFLIKIAKKEDLQVYEKIDTLNTLIRWFI